MSDEKRIQEALRRLLPTLDLETATQRTIQQKLEEELGQALDQHKTLLKVSVPSPIKALFLSLSLSPLYAWSARILPSKKEEKFKYDITNSSIENQEENS